VATCSSTASLEKDIEEVNGLGGISRQYLNHHHEASPACDWVAETFGAPLHVHEDDARAASEICEVGETFSERHKIGDGFEGRLHQRSALSFLFLANG
jgi:hypothetical protein